MATAELRGSFEPDSTSGDRRRREPTRATPAWWSDAL
jgi:hypothetical protein